MDRSRERQYAQLSPFELKGRLVQLARRRDERLMLNAARGNPNWLALVAREAFFALGQFAVEESARTAPLPGLGGAPERFDIVARFSQWGARNGSPAAVDFLQRALRWARVNLGFEEAAVLYEWADAILGDHYPTPGRFLPCCEGIVHRALEKEVLRGVPVGRFDLFATEGATAAIRYVFDSLSHAGFVQRGDSIALGVPIFTPYIEVPRLHEYDLIEINIAQQETGGWQYPDSELEKLLDPRVKVFLVVNPSNPTSTAIHPDSAARIARLVKTRRPDLIVITDDVYATFVRAYVCLATLIPENTILIYSWSKAWGCTGWRLGLIALHEQNILDARLSQRSAQDKIIAQRRYGSLTPDVVRLRFMDRLLADSRAVGLNHTAGLSTPQQVQMTLLALQALLDVDDAYHHSTWEILRARHRSLFDAVGLTWVDDPCCAHYYATIDVPALARHRHGDRFARWLMDEHEAIDFVVRLAEEKGVVLMDGGGFEAPRMSVRVSLANLPNAAYTDIGRAISELLEDYYLRWQMHHQGGRF